MKTYTEQKHDLLQRINELSAEITANDPEANTERLKAVMNKAAANGASDDELSELSKAVRLAAMGADEVGTRYSIAMSRKQAAEQQLAQLEEAEANRIKKKRETQLQEIANTLLPKAKAEYLKIFQKTVATHCKLAALVDAQLRTMYALRNNPNLPLNGASPADHISLPIPFGSDGILNQEDYIHYQIEKPFTDAFAEARDAVNAELESIG